MFVKHDDGNDHDSQRNASQDRVIVLMLARMFAGLQLEALAEDARLRHQPAHRRHLRPVLRELLPLARNCRLATTPNSQRRESVVVTDLARLF